MLLSDVLLSGFTACTKHSIKVRGMGFMCSYPVLTVALVLEQHEESTVNENFFITEVYSLK